MKTSQHDFIFEKVTPSDLKSMRELLEVYAVAFDDAVSYRSRPPSDDYLKSLLAKETFITVVARLEGRVVGGLSAYVLEKFEQERSEIYIYDLAVLEAYRRKGAARGVIDHLKRLAKSYKAWVIYVQADKVDEPAIRLYDSMGTREDVFHFDIDLE
ncbi:MAG TPA: AAC(3)-I family aminoglycoside N-acetyltransferase [Oligoflexus sp.]|uniref:AAC(3)-I family aminoglycoside N-acetyltransferase n=1 Tax=Oligoflexus sp. TaxID=1971216 RepID=UPI002D5ED32E|nr:AAC(3)-I family aminoglycoside N-acetyltransferase [Oligoflexus sp.]HYX38381.1 AAC(3)-I family aminoglycoside N-acetyltransferase [Oligoflexus sp.]